MRKYVRDRRGRFARKSGGGGKKSTAHYYGKGRKGRRAAKKATYGSKRHGLSIAQQRRRRQKRKRQVKAAGKIASYATTGYLAYAAVRNQATRAGTNRLRRNIHKQAANAARARRNGFAG